jgi:hypothetical protein
MCLMISATHMNNNWTNVHKLYSKEFQVTTILPQWMLITMHGYYIADTNSYIDLTLPKSSKFRIL